jgi:hypothetical protein
MGLHQEARAGRCHAVPGSVGRSCRGASVRGVWIGYIPIPCRRLCHCPHLLDKEHCSELLWSGTSQMDR